MGFDKNKVINIAKAEVGYKEKRSNAYLNSKTANAGSANYTKYGKDMHNLYPEIMDFPAPWCDAFVDWCFYKAYGVANARGLLGGNFDDYTVASAQLYKKKGAYNKNAQVGSQIFFKNSSGICHTGLVYKVANGKVYTIEGNTSNMVAYREYPAGHSSIDGYGHPSYGGTTSTASPAPTTTKKDTKIDSVIEVQRWLNNSYGFNLVEDNIYGPKTRTALIKVLQSCLGVKADGIVGPKTRAAMKRHVVRYGSKGALVKVAQAFLVCNGYTSAYVDGEFGRGTKKATESYQRKKGLKVDAEIGINSWSTMCAA